MKVRVVLLLSLLVFSLAIYSIFVVSPRYLPQERKRIAFDETHGEVHSISDGYAKFCDLLRVYGFEVEPLREAPLTLSRIRAYSVLILPLPRKPLLDDEIRSIISFVEGGGGLFIIGDCGGDQFWGSNLNNLSRIFGITFNTDIIKASREPVIINRFKQHPVTAGIQKVICRTGASLNVTGDAIGLAAASDEAWADRLTGRLGILEQREAKGRNITVLAVSEFGLGRVVCLGSSTLFIDSNLLSDHKKLGLNILRWLSSPEPLRASIENGLVRLKFFDDNLHSSYQIDVWDEEAEKWVTAYHDVRFYTTSLRGFNFTWNIGGTSVKTKIINGYKALIVKYPERGRYGHISEIIDIGLEGDEDNLYGGGWSEPLIFHNRTVRKVLPEREDVHLLLDYPDHPWLQYNLSLTCADSGRGRVDLNALSWKGWITIKSFHINGTDRWVKITASLNLSDFYVEPETNKIRLGIHVEGDPLIIDEVSLSSAVQSGSIEILALLSKDYPVVYFFIRKSEGFDLNGVGIIGELATKLIRGKRFVASSLLLDAFSENKYRVWLTKGSYREILNLGTDEAYSKDPSPERSMYIYGDGWSEIFTLKGNIKAREVLAGRTNAFLVIPQPPSLNVLYNLSISYLDLTRLPIDINLFNGTDWIPVGHISRENTGAWRKATFSISPSEMYFDPTVGGVKIGLYAYGSSLVVSKIEAEWKTLEDRSAVTAFSCCGKDKIINFILTPKEENQIFRHEVDSGSRLIRTIDIFTILSPLSKEKKILPIAAVGSYILDTSSFLIEAESLVSEGWRPMPAEFSRSFTPRSLAIARLNASSISFTFPVLNSSVYSVFVRYLDHVENPKSKMIIVSVNGHEVGRINFEGSGTFQIWRKEIGLQAGMNTVTLTPISKIPSSEIAFIDYVLVMPEFWEEKAAHELKSIERNLTGEEYDF
ncbi:hypothetical protein CW705_04735 [Candidatus Bathyarchaeota archaeon]|nr:MAG: hypothetical protein CW705_04735 [Candidatus Bathyarchaeota archaeon]